MKQVVLCDNHSYLISDADFEALKRVSPGYARLAKDCAVGKPTHYVCERCGQIPPLKLRPLHRCEGR